MLARSPDVARDPARRRVLIVERLPLVAEALSTLLAQQGFQVVGATDDVKRAARLLAEGTPEVLLIDASLAADAINALAQAAALAGPSAHVVFLDDRLRANRLSHALRAGARGYWTKHASANRTAEWLRRVAGGESVFCDEASELLEPTERGWKVGKSRGSPFALLTPRERELVPYFARGVSVRETAKIVRRAASTIDNHKARLMKKLGLHRVAELTRLAIREGIIDE